MNNMLLKITGGELRKALADIEAAEKNGFMFCEAVFSICQESDTWISATYSDLWEKAHPTDSRLNWGRNQGVSKHNRFVDGKLVPTAEAQQEYDNYPASKAIASGEMNGLKWWIVPGPSGGLNGYVAFPKRPVIESGYGGILTYVPVHGGITFAEQKNVGMIYGFDTGHCDSEEYPRTDHEWIKKQIGKMIDGIRMAQKVEKKYLVSKSNKTKAKYAQMVLDTDQDKENQRNFGINVNMLCGKL